VTMSGGFSKYVVLLAQLFVQYKLSSSDGSKVFKIQNITDEEATLVKPAACAIHGLDKLAAPVGIEVLIIGAGPTGLILAQKHLNRMLITCPSDNKSIILTYLVIHGFLARLATTEYVLCMLYN
jgi:hypothetical protein